MLHIFSAIFDALSSEKSGCGIGSIHFADRILLFEIQSAEIKDVQLNS